ncbi:hypothetical protein KKJ25_07920 [Xenorhabdus bovienii]|uniref:hypothetical protein n=2 Tax=Xenorhabdus bovienii TaxID=40576 RepID=UPI00237C6BE2|nr:hypothetical protein [Xenorhabdus bovienii]MDE1494880.1 hypothetical protein [Xenorhabdus bovienii]MDE9473503.1 hypothetical protein [Xenorhabdus bovienii]
MRFKDLTEASQQKAREALVNALNIEMESRRYIDDNRAKYIARNIRDSFIALESEDPKIVAGDDGAKDEEAGKDVKLCDCILVGGVDTQADMTCCTVYGCKQKGDLDFEGILNQRNKEIQA